MFKSIWKTIVNAIKVAKAFITGNVCKNMSSPVVNSREDMIVVNKGDKLKLLPWLLGLYRNNDFDSSYAYGKELKKRMSIDIASCMATGVIWFAGMMFNLPFNTVIFIIIYAANLARLMVRNMKLAQAAIDA
ncbi:hypothetical protein N1M2_169 [Klebsiella phage N1M2]|uniref:Uncharacterized protein n=1 Tax=Klebsiella phage N1M2 TaxID=2664939 RepID=A0A6B7ZF78_9CAUD|nr:hypothetical protein PQB72_gp169 [Klebsiella phage N1M2]QGH72032.1 hypothetical protein N1M2_169 [Klebsiella phage N1M2]